MVVMLGKVRKYGRERRHIEIAKDHYSSYAVGELVVVIDAKTYDRVYAKILELLEEKL